MEIVSDTSNKETSTRNDSKLRAIIFMNGFSICCTGVGVTFKGLAAEGVSNLDFGVCRAIVGLIGSITILLY